jgi:hypothetical protein
MESRANERRRKPRIETQLSASIAAGDERIEATVKNMSESGLLLLVDQPVKEMTLVGLKLALPPSRSLAARIAFEIQGAVVRCAKAGRGKKAQWEVAVFMTGIPHEAKLALHDYVQSRLAQVVK